MILYNIVLGNLKLAPNAWSHTIDEHGNHFITKDDIHQRIRIDGKVDQSTYPELGDLTPVWSASNMQCYNILPGTRWVNNNRNMNPMLLTSKEYVDGKDQIVIYLTVSNNYSIARFLTPHRILQTYHKKDTLQGCAIVLDSNDRDADNRIISISVYDKKKDQYSQFNISFMRDDLNKISIDRKAITNKKTLDAVKAQTGKFNNRYMGFKIITKPNDLLTLTYITSEKFKDDVAKAVKNIKQASIHTINPEQLEDPAYVETFVAKLQTEFENGRVRSLTQCGVNLPLEVVRRLKLLYVFNYDVKNNVLSCKKSN